MASPFPTVDAASKLSDSIPDDESCQLLGPTALVVQGVLGILVIISLVYKRHREPRKRPWRIWLFDVSKQVVGQMFIHGANVFVSGLVSQHTSGNACVFYFLHILLDTTLGVGLLYVILHVLTNIFSEKLHFKGFESGIYGTPPSFNFWARQAALYVTALTTMKLIVILILLVFPGIFFVGEWLLSWTRVGTGDHLQVIFTMGMFPIIMNVLQFWLIDSIVKASSKPSVALDDDASDVSPQDREPLFRAPSDDEDDHNPYRASDVENARHPRPRSPARQHDKRLTVDSTPEEYKSDASSSADELNDHAYPPNPANGSSRNVTPKPAKNLVKKANKRRAAPAPLSLQTNHIPAVNSPGVLAMPQPLAPQPQSLPVRKVEAVGTVDQDAWAETWDDSDDWANQVGEEDWPGRRVAQKKDTHHAWNAGHGGAIQVS